MSGKKQGAVSRVPDSTESPGFFKGLRLLFALSFLLVGGYYELSAAVISVGLCLLLLWQSKQEGLRLRMNDGLLAVLVLFLFYLLSALWAVDRGMALLGAVKYLPLPLFGLALLQCSGEERGKLLADLPLIGSVMTVLSFGLQFVPTLKDQFSVSGRLAGLFLYPNTFACFLLLGLVILLSGAGEWDRKRALPMGLILSFGLFQAGSRTIFVMLIPAVLVAVLLAKDKKCSLLLLGMLVAGLALSGLAGLASLGGTDRLVITSAGSATLLGRLLYWKDALPVIARHPLGLGYLGYFFTQGSFQTGAYTVRWVHNDLLQLLLDVGWIPAILAVVAVVHALFSRRTTGRLRLVLLVLLAHCMMDFDLEFISMYFVLLLCLDWEDQKVRWLHPAFGASVAAAVLLCLGGLVSGLSAQLQYFGQNQAAATLYPWNTLAQIELLANSQDLEQAEDLSDRILSRNTDCVTAWQAKAICAYAQGDFSRMMTCQRQVIQLARYDLQGYTDYFAMLTVGYDLFVQAGDTASAQALQEEITTLQPMLDTLQEQTDPLAEKLPDQPELTMPEEYAVWLAEH